MKQVIDPKKLPLTVFLLGLLAMVLRWLVGMLAIDGRGLILPGHPVVVALWVVSAVAAVLVLISVRTLDGGRKYEANFSTSRSAAFGCGVMALCAIFTGVFSSELAGLGLIHKALAVAAGVGMAFVAFARFRGITPNFFYHAVACVFFAIHMVSRYRPWSGDPALLEYVFEVFACVGLMLFAYHQAAFAVGMGKRRTELTLGLLTAFCCLAALPGSEYPLLYAGGGVWTVTNLCSLTPPPRRKRAVPEAPRQDAHETA